VTVVRVERAAGDVVVEQCVELTIGGGTGCDAVLDAGVFAPKG
jgi:hypothetical protein